MPLLILVVLLVFNTIIFVHELGHFWAARWRGLKIDRFQIWFGKPIWSKKINGVQWGLGWIPFGGFVALPQMAPMESIEGTNREDDGPPLPKISPLDKIIVAFAGPLFSFLLAFVCAVVVWAVKTPADITKTTTIGYVEPGKPAAKAGLLRGDVIKAINGEPVHQWYAPGVDNIAMKVITSEGERIEFTIDRPGAGEMKLYSEFDIAPTKWYERRGIRDVFMDPMATRVYVANVTKDAPADRAGLKEMDEILAYNGAEPKSDGYLREQLKANKEAPVNFLIKRMTLPSGKPPEDWALLTDPVTTIDGKTPEQPTTLAEFLKSNGSREIEFTVSHKASGGAEEIQSGKILNITIQPMIPVKYPQGVVPYPMVGVGFRQTYDSDDTMVAVSPFKQIGQALDTMWMTITKVISPRSSIGVDQLSGPLGIVQAKLTLLSLDHGWERLLGFMVLLNINLAILNMLPFPVLDGGHITMAIIEAISGRPARAKILEIIQISFAMLLFSLMIYLTSKDAASMFGGGKQQTYEFAPAK